MILKKKRGINNDNEPFKLKERIMSNQTNGLWKGLYWESNTIIIGNSGWLAILTLILIRLILRILLCPIVMFKEEPKPIQDLVVQCFNQDKEKKNVRIELMKRKVEGTKQKTLVKIDILGILHRKL